MVEVEVEVDGPDTNTKKILRPAGLNHFDRFRSFGCEALKVRVSL